MPFQSLSMTKTSPILNQWSVVVQQRNQIRTADFNTPRNQTRWFTTNNRPTDTNNNNNNNDNNSSSSDNSDTPKSDNINEPKPSTNHNNPPRHLTSSERWMERLTVAMRPLEAKIRASATFQDVSSLLDEMERRKYNYRRYVILGVAFFLWLFYDFITRFFSNRVADISKTYLENPQFKRDIEQFIRSPEIQASAKSLVTSVINDPEVQQRLQTLLSNTLSKTIADDKLREGIYSVLIFLSLTHMGSKQTRENG
jgi:flagellar biosynthesis GTPase FlhF